MATENTESTERVLRIQNSEFRSWKFEAGSWKGCGYHGRGYWIPGLACFTRSPGMTSLFRHSGRRTAPIRNPGKSIGYGGRDRCNFWIPGLASLARNDEKESAARPE